jgi:hypothetical protein
MRDLDRNDNSEAHELKISTAAAVAGLGLAIAVGGAPAQTYPVKPVRIVVPTSRGRNGFVARREGRLGDRLGSSSSLTIDRARRRRHHDRGESGPTVIRCCSAKPASSRCSHVEKTPTTRA